MPVPEPYRRLFFSTNIEVVLSVLAYIALVTHLLVFDPGNAEIPLLDALFGPEPPVITASVPGGGRVSRHCGEPSGTTSTS